MRTLYIFTKPDCKHCTVAKNTIVQYGHRMWETNIEAAPAIKALLKKAGFTTVPIIYDGEHLVGGYTELVPYLASIEGITIDQATS